MSRLTSVMKLPKRFTFVFVASIVFCTVGSVYAMDFGAPCSWGSHWPKNWPKELEPLRKQAWHWVDGSLRPANAPPATHLSSRYDIPFADREAFESAWPHILKLKSKGVPVTLLRGSHLSVRTGREAAGVRIPVNIPVTPVDPKAVRIVIGDSKAVGAAVPPSNVTGIELVVDGDIVDLNRIPLPADTPVIDKRFKEQRDK